MAFARKRNPHIQFRNRLVDCDRCGYTIHLADSKLQNGLRLDEACADLQDNQLPRRD